MLIQSHLASWPLVMLLFSLLACTDVRTATPPRSSSLANAADTPEPSPEQMLTALDKSCGVGSCHRAADTGKLPYVTLRRFASQTRSYDQCLQLRSCFKEPLSKEEAALCWQCITGSGGLLEPRGGIYQAAIKGGVVEKIASASGIDVSGASTHLEWLSMQALRMPPYAEEVPDFVKDTQTFRAISAWLSREADNNFKGIEALRPKSELEPEGVEAKCDEFSPLIAQSIVPDFSMEGVSMFGCDSASWPEHPEQCLKNFADQGQWSDSNSQGVTVKLLRRLEGQQSSYYWLRTAPDGRYVSLGNGRMEDLKTQGRSIIVNSNSIDPAFSPDNKFYLWPSMICPIAALSDLSLSAVGDNVPASGCVSQAVGVYASLGADLNGDTLLISGYTNNNSGHDALDANDMPGDEGGFSIRRISNSSLVNSEELRVPTPFETDYQIAPSGSLIVGRFKRAGGGQAYRVRVLRPDGQTIRPQNNESTGTICMKGEKANISYDNRFVTFHHYADGSPQDQGASERHPNIFVYDLLKKRSLRVTNMKDGAKALFPHFRADGWLMFLVREPSGVESIAASNAAMVLKGQP